MQGVLWRLWAGEAVVLGRLLWPVLAPLALTYRAALALRSRIHERSQAERVGGVAVVSVGNLAIGGTGKTPLAAWAARQLSAAGRKAALVTRGYGRDEPLLHARWNPEVPVVVGADRVAGARRAAAQGATVAVLDDAFQHRRLHRDVDLVLLAAEDDFPGHVLPRGPYREPTGALARAHAVIVTRRGAPPRRAEALSSAVAKHFPHLVMARVHLAAGVWQDLEGRAADAPRGPVLAVAAVARPGAFAAFLEARLAEGVELVPYADHHDYTSREVEALVERAGTRTIVVTEKDAVKLAAFSPLLAGARVLTQEIRWEGGEDAVRRLVLDGGRGAASP